MTRTLLAQGRPLLRNLCLGRTIWGRWTCRFWDISVRRADHGRKRFARVVDERAVDNLDVDLLGRCNWVEFPVLLGFVNQKRRQILRFVCHFHCIVRLNVLTGGEGTARRNTILLKPICRNRQTLKVGLSLQQLKHLLIILIAQSRRIDTHLFCLTARQSCRAVKLNEFDAA